MISWFWNNDITWTVDLDHWTAAVNERSERQNKWLSRWQYLQFSNWIRSRDKVILRYKPCCAHRISRKRSKHDHCNCPVCITMIHKHKSYRVHCISRKRSRHDHFSSHGCITMMIIVLQPVQSSPRRRQLTQSCCTPRSRQNSSHAKNTTTRWSAAQASLPSPPTHVHHPSFPPYYCSPTSGLQLWGGERVQCATKNTSASQRLSEQLAMWTSMSVLWTLWFLLMWASMINLMPYAMIVLVP